MNESQNLHLLGSASAVSFYRPPGAPRIHFDEKGAGAGDGAGGGSGAGDGKGDGDGKGAGDGSGSGPGPSGQSSDGQSQDGKGDGVAAPYRPEGLPDHLYGKSDKETIDHLHKAYGGARAAIGEKGDIPEKADGYTFEAGEKLAPHVANFDKDPVYNAVRGIAKEAGLTTKQFQTFMPKVLEHFVESGLVDAAVDPKAMLRSVAPASMEKASDAEREAAGSKIVTDNIAWVDQMKATQAMPPAAADFLAAQAADAPGAHALINFMRGNSQELLPALNGGNGSSGLTDADMKARINDPRNNPSAKEYDKAFALQTDDLSKKHYG